MKKIHKELILASAGSTAVTLVALFLIPIFILSFFHAEKLPLNEKDAPIKRIKPPKTVQVYITSSKTVQNIGFEDYVTGVVAAEMPSSFEPEALKAQAVAARTYSLSKVLRSGDGGFPDAQPAAALCDDVHCQAYRSKEALAAQKGAAWMETGYRKIQKAVSDTKGEMMYYDGALVSQALFHSSSGGRTENSEDVFASTVPYLRSVDSPYEEGATHKNEQVTLSLLELSSKLNSAFQNRGTGNFTASDISVSSRTEGGNVACFTVGKASYTGREIRTALNLASSDFTVAASGESVTFTTNGYGHGVGMSQYGANGMAKEGYTYKEILAHYYTGIRVL